MTTPAPAALRHFAFLSVCEREGTGAFGGMLVVNPIGRPLEFHCTTPVLPSRTQSILFGTTLREFLYCEQIGQALVKQARSTPDLVLVRQEELLGLHGLVECPLVWLGTSGESSCGWKNGRQSLDFPIGSQTCRAVGLPQSLTSLQSALEAFHAALPVDEPFERIQKAIEEAQAVAR